MAFTSFNLSRLKSVFRRAVAAFGFGTDSAIRARVQEEAAGSAVWARFAPSVAGYPVLPRVAGNLQIDEPAALTALAGGSDTLSYTAPVFKVGHTLIPLSEFSWGLPFDDTQDGGIAAQFADDWGYTLEIPRMDSSWTVPDLSDTGTSIGKRIAFINSNPGRFKLSCKTRSILSWENTSVTEGIFSGTSLGNMHNVPDGIIIHASDEYSLPGGRLTMSTGGTSGFLRDSAGTIVTSSGRSMLKPNFTDVDAVGSRAWAAAEADQVTQINGALTADAISVVINGQEYQPSNMAGSGEPNYFHWTPSTVYSANAYCIGPEGHRYKTTAGGTSGSTAPTGTGTGISDGGVTWDWNSSPLWLKDPEILSWIDTIKQYPSTDAGNTAYFDAISGSKGRQEKLVYDAHKAVDSSISYIYYQPLDLVEGIGAGTTRSATRRTRCVQGVGITHIVPQASDYAGWEFYRGYWSSYTSLAYVNGGAFRGVTLPEEVTNCIAQTIDAGYKLMYPFIASTWGPGYSSTSNGPDDLYMGFVKFIYTCGAIGCVPGYYQPGPINGSWVIGSGASDQVRQFCVIGHVQATFSHLENYIRSGTLLDGDYDPWSRGYSSHILSKNIYGQNNGFDHPSYEFIHDDSSQLNTKVVARKLDASNDWLICAWHCHDSADVTVHSTIAGHALTLNARRGGTLYHMDNAGTLTMLDPLSMDPSRTIATILAGL